MMPDGLTHLAVGYIGVFRWLQSARLALFFLGSLLPDILLRGGRLLFTGHPKRDFLELYLVPLHTPVTSFLLCLALAQLFHPRMRKTAFSLLFGGCLAHFALDILQRTINGNGFTVEILDGYHWLYPFSWFDFQFGLFWAGDSPYALIILVPVSLWLWIIHKKQTCKINN